MKQAIAGINILLILLDLVVGKYVETVAGQSLEWLLAATVMAFHLSFVEDLSGASFTLVVPTRTDNQHPASTDGIEEGLLPCS